MEKISRWEDGEFKIKTRITGPMGCAQRLGGRGKNVYSLRVKRTRISIIRTKIEIKFLVRQNHQTILFREFQTDNIFHELHIYNNTTKPI